MTNLFPNALNTDLIARATSHYTPSYRQAPLFLVRGEGVWVWDRDGKRYLDFIAGIAVNSVGHAHPRLVAAIHEQADAVIHVSNLYYNEPALALLDKLVELSFADRVYFGNSGTEANEAALKLARRYQTRVKSAPDKTGILAFENSFHGRTYASVSVTGQPKYHDGFEPMLAGVHFARFGDLEHVASVLAQAGGTIGTMIVEPIQCEGGLNMPPAGFLKGLRKLCDQHGVVLIYDEVQTGVGRCAEWWCYEIDAVRPDILTSAKGIGGGVPLSAMLCTDEVAQGWGPGSHASTFGGNPLATRAGLEVLRIIEEEHLLDNAYKVGEALAEGLEALVKRHPDKCADPRGVGLLRGLRIRDEGAVAGIVEAARHKGLLLNGVRGGVLRMVPPLIVQTGHVTAALEILDEVLAAS